MMICLVIVSDLRVSRQEKRLLRTDCSFSSELQEVSVGTVGTLGLVFLFVVFYPIVYNQYSDILTSFKRTVYFLWTDLDDLNFIRLLSLEQFGASLKIMVLVCCSPAVHITINTSYKYKIMSLFIDINLTIQW